MPRVQWVSTGIYALSPHGGLAITLATTTLERVATRFVSGSAQSQGRLVGGASAWTYTGVLAGANFKAVGFSAGRVTGPVVVARKKGELTVQSTLTGAGGGGSGYLAALLGPRPVAEIQYARLSDGRQLIRKLKAVGTGLKLDATGERTLLGGLSFKGDAQLTNLRAAGPGSKGTATTAWTASQGGVGKPWLVSVDGKGVGFATGYAELDRLLGAAPRFKGKAEITGRQFAVQSAELTGALANARAAGLIGPAGALSAAHRYRAGRHGLNLGDCLHYAVAKYHGIPILATADEFRQTDLETVP
eukprot:gene8211-11125_t